jgi:hypothetical protein
MTTEQKALQLSHAIIRQALDNIRLAHGLPADDYNTIYQLLNNALSHIETRQGGSTQLTYYSY